jgi:hypothetical protein
MERYTATFQQRANGTGKTRQFAVKAIRPSSRVAFNLSGSLISGATKPNSSTHAIALKQSCRSSKWPSPMG